MDGGGGSDVGAVLVVCGLRGALSRLSLKPPAFGADNLCLTTLSSSI